MTDADLTTAGGGALELFAHPFSSYCWKVLIALWENDTPFTYRSIVDPANATEWQRLSAMGKMPLLVDGSHVVPETTIIIEHLALTRPGPVSLIPSDAIAALEPRLLDRMADAYLMTPTTALVTDRMRAEGERDPVSVTASKALLDKSYTWWDEHMSTRQWAAGDFGLADCAAAPALFYADWVHPIHSSLKGLKAYRARLLERPSIARAIEEARPFRALFPGGAPDRD